MSIGRQAEDLHAQGGKNWHDVAVQLDIRDKSGRPNALHAARLAANARRRGTNAPTGTTPRPQAPAARPAPAPTPKRRQREVDPEAQAQLHAELMKGAKLLTLLINESIRPTEDELDAVLSPAERLAIRNLGLPSELDPNVVDVLHLIGGIAAYALRVARTTDHRVPARVMQPAAPARFTAPGSAPTGGSAPGAAQNPPGGTNGHLPGASLQDQLRSMHDRAYAADAERGIGAPSVGDGDAAETGG